MRIKRVGIIIGIMLFLVVAFVLFLVKKKASSPVESQKIISPHYGSITSVITTTATVLPKNRLEIKPTVTGRVEQVLVKEGEDVKAGQILAWMSSTDRAALLDSARGQGEKEYAYWRDVYKPIPLLAPINGQVIVATTQPGQTITSADSVVVLSDHLIVRAQVDETDIGKIKQGQAANIGLDAYPDTKIKAEVDHLYYESKAVNNVTIYEVDLKPQEVPAFFRSGMNASVDFIIQSKDHVLLIPAAAITKKDDQTFVWLKGPQKNKPIKQEIQTGLSDEKNVEVLSGLTEDDELEIKSKKFSSNKAKSGTNPFMTPRTGRGGR